MCVCETFSFNKNGKLLLPEQPKVLNIKVFAVGLANLPRKNKTKSENKIKLTDKKENAPFVNFLPTERTNDSSFDLASSGAFMILSSCLVSPGDARISLVSKKLF